MTNYQLVKGFQEALESSNNREALKTFVDRVLLIICPRTSAAPWFYGLGPAKRNSIKYLYSRGKRISGRLKTYSDQELRPESLCQDLRDWSSYLRTLELALGSMQETKTTSGWELIAMRGVSSYQVGLIRESLVTVTEKLLETFPQVIYGNLYLASHLQRGKAAWYVPALDTLYIDVNATHRLDYTYTLLHELGHRWDYKFFKGDLKTKFFELSTRGVYGTNRQLLRGKIAVTPYGGKNPTENIAEAFAHYVLGMSLDSEIQGVIDAWRALV